MESNQLILASASPRRAELLKTAGFTFEIDPATGPERTYPVSDGGALTEYLARDKAAEVFARHRSAVVLGSDTLVTLRGLFLGKPKTPEEAVSMLNLLSGRTHTVCTSVCVMSAQQTASFRCKTAVTFRPVSQAEIIAYVQSGEPMDKAGSYGIQGIASRFVTSIEGDYSSVVGLPVGKTAELLMQFGVLPADLQGPARS